MGARKIASLREGTSAQEIFDYLYGEADDRYKSTREYEYDNYSGDWNTISRFHEYRKIDFSKQKYSKKNLDAVYKIENEISDSLDAREAVYINLGVSYYEAVKKKIVKRKTKAIKAYCLVNSDTGKEKSISAKTEKEAGEILLENSDKYDSVKVVIENELGWPCIPLQVKTEKKKYKSMPKKIPAGYTVKPVYMFYLIGEAKE